MTEAEAVLPLKRQRAAAEARAGVEEQSAADLVGEPFQAPLQQRLGAHQRIHLGQRWVPLAGHVCSCLRAQTLTAFSNRTHHHRMLVDGNTKYSTAPAAPWHAPARASAAAQRSAAGHEGSRLCHAGLRGQILPWSPTCQSCSVSLQSALSGTLTAAASGIWPQHP